MMHEYNINFSTEMKGIVLEWKQLWYATKDMKYEADLEELAQN